MEIIQVKKLVEVAFCQIVVPVSFVKTGYSDKNIKHGKLLWLPNKISVMLLQET